ncbi:TIGR02452 family protein [Polyangium aurulentum]|uniref:TIGR02452 family protein n=1 Tax=Polyangium aurulentum TaxID=2567896 RepID=UPI0010ADF636|nr:TIGR02452 family protein [Polyangium aurulentum]UQA62812.1 TIGR02452 family protein [Polyangium aurulentum]
MSLTGVAKETLAIIEQGSYVAPSGRTVSVRELVDAAVHGTMLYRPADLDGLLAARARPGHGVISPRIEITPETTAEAARRLVEKEGEQGVVALNFASAKNPGGGFIGGAKAQEEDLARCSALYTCQIGQQKYYDENRATQSMLYTDHIIYSPDVPFFRDDQLDLLEQPFVVSIITAPAPNAGEAARKGEGEAARVREVLQSRARKVLAVAAAHGHRCLVLGAWGCGVFRNDPREVAEAFALGLADGAFAGAFDRVVFAIWERNPDRPTMGAFVERFGAVG